MQRAAAQKSKEDVRKVKQGINSGDPFALEGESTLLIQIIILYCTQHLDGQGELISKKRFIPSSKSFFVVGIGIGCDLLTLC